MKFRKKKVNEPEFKPSGSSVPRTVKALDEGQLDFMYRMLMMGEQKSNVPRLKEYLDMLRQLMIQKTGGQKQYAKENDVSFEDLGTIVNGIVIESLSLYLSGDLDRLEHLLKTIERSKR